MRKINIALSFMAILIVLSGCIKIPIGDGQTLKLSKDGITFSDSEGKESSFSLDEDNESISFSNDDGDSWDAEFGEDVELPEDFPTQYLPMPKGVEIMAVQKMDLDDGKVTTISYQYAGDAQELADMYIESFEKNNFDELQYETLGQDLEEMGFMTIHGMKDDASYIIQVIDSDEDGVQVSIMYGEDHEE